jgi:hypothetical protein
MNEAPAGALKQPALATLENRPKWQCPGAQPFSREALHRSVRQAHGIFQVRPRPRFAQWTRGLHPSLMFRVGSERPKLNGPFSCSCQRHLLPPVNLQAAFPDSRWR